MNRAEYDEAVSKCPNGPHDEKFPFRYCPSCPWTERGWQDPDAWKPRYLVTKAPGVGGEPIPHDEPVLVIRAQDKMAEEMLEAYIDSYREFDDYSDAVVEDLEAHLRELRRWQEANRERIKMAGR